MKATALEKVVAFAFVLVLAVVLGVIALCLPDSKPGPAGPPVVMEVLDPSLQVFATMWQEEVGRRFPHAVAILVHGGYVVNGQWIVGVRFGAHYVTAQEVVEYTRQRYPDRTIVLLACNTDHQRLGIPGVYYAHSSVWCVPDRDVTGSMLDDLKLMARPQKPIPVAVKHPAAHPPPPYRVQPDADDVIVPKSRWAMDPEVVGNIFEFSAD